jgi:hypothetical protein
MIEQQFVRPCDECGKRSLSFSIMPSKSEDEIILCFDHAKELYERLGEVVDAPTEKNCVGCKHWGNGCGNNWCFDCHDGKDNWQPKGSKRNEEDN